MWRCGPGGFFCACLVALVATNPVSAFDQSEELIREVTAIGNTLAKAMLDGDVDPMLSLCAEDAISLPNFEPRMQRVFIKGNIYQAWDAIPDRCNGPSGPTDPTPEYGSTVFALKS